MGNVANNNENTYIMKYYIDTGDSALTFILGFHDKNNNPFVRELFNKIHDDYNLLLCEKNYMLNENRQIYKITYK